LARAAKHQRYGLAKSSASLGFGGALGGGGGGSGGGDVTSGGSVADGGGASGMDGFADGSA